MATVDGNKVGVVGYAPKNKWLAENRYTIIDTKYRGIGYGNQLTAKIARELLEFNNSIDYILGPT